MTDTSRSNRSMNTIHTASSDATDRTKNDGTPFPFLEFRIVNDHANFKKRAVRNAHVTAMVQLSARDAQNAKGSLNKRASSRNTFTEYVSVASKDTSTKEEQKPSSPFDVEGNDSSNSLRSSRILQMGRNRRAGLKLSASILATALLVQETDNDDDLSSGLEGRVSVMLVTPCILTSLYIIHSIFIWCYLLSRCTILSP